MSKKYFYVTSYGIVELLPLLVELSLPMIILPMLPIKIDELSMDIDMLYCTSTAELKTSFTPLLPESNLLLKH